MAEMQNKFVNNFKLKVELYLSASGATCDVIDIMNNIRFSAYYIIVNNFKYKLINKYPLNIRNLLFEYVNKIKNFFF